MSQNEWVYNVVEVRMQTSTHNKFYRVYTCGGQEVRQWGAIGSVGQSSVKEHLSSLAASSSARKILDQKRGKGYRDSKSGTMQVAAQAVQGKEGKELVRILDATFTAGVAQGVEFGGEHNKFVQPNEAVSGAATETMQQIADRALGVVTLAASGSPDAAIEYARVRAELKEVEEQFERCQGFLETVEMMLSTGVGSDA